MKLTRLLLTLSLLATSAFARPHTGVQDGIMDGDMDAKGFKILHLDTSNFTYTGDGSHLTGITESQIVGLVSDLAAKVPTSRTVSTTGPLAGGGALSGNITLSIADFIGSGASHARGTVPDPGASAGISRFLREDGTWSVLPALTGDGSGITNIAEAQITGLVADLAAKVPTSRTVSTTGPLSGGGALSGNLTLAITDFVASGASHARGTVPDPGVTAGTTKFLREDATWQPISGSAGGTVTSVSVVTANGISGTVATSTSTPAITLSLAIITPTSISVAGTGGLGFIQFPFQTSTVVAPAANFGRLYADSSGYLSYKSPSGFAFRFSGASLTANHIQTIQDKDGTIADTSDLAASVTGIRKSTGAGTTDVAAIAKTDYWDASVFVASGGSHAKGLVPDSPASAGALKFLREDATWATIYNSTITIPASDIDWSTSDTFKKTLAANTTFTFSNVANKTIVVAITNTINNYTVTWPVVKWVGGTAPTQTIGVHTDVYTFVYIGSDIYGSVLANF